MEYGLGRSQKAAEYGVIGCVLILVLMEYGLGLVALLLIVIYSICLNPCFNGIWSRTT